MSFGEGNLHDRVEYLEAKNGKLCDEVNELQRRIDSIVRCMDCKWFTNSSHYGAYCMNFVAPLHDDYDGFCAWGERKVDA